MTSETGSDHLSALVANQICGGPFTPAFFIVSLSLSHEAKAFASSAVLKSCWPGFLTVSTRPGLIFVPPSLLRPLPIRPVLAAGRKTAGGPNLCAMIARSCEKSGLDGLPKDDARCAAAGIVGDDRYAVRIRLAEELHAEALMKGDRARVGRRRYRLDVPAALGAGELDEVAEKVPGETASPRGCPHRDRMHISDRLGLRDEAEQISDDPGSVTDDERRVSKLMDQERVVQVTRIAPIPDRKSTRLNSSHVKI